MNAGSRPGERPLENLVPTDAELAETVRSIWLDVLELSDCADTDDFFDLGGNSLSAVLLAAQLEDRLRVEVPLDAIFFQATLAAVTAACASELPNR
ncbi:phosphopantetheine-binding protein [Actinoplanes sp. NPDC048791]|uniref:phosphopantetheine-binding protein n=1 Tax=Actinoplanes sp. NPDC048791 TaxID=3154623 RepID=UPI0033D31E81